MPNNVYIGSRYVPIFDGAWDNTKSYEPLTIVEYGNNTYTSKRPVPVGTLPTNTTYWALTGNYNGQIAHLQDQIDDNTSDITALTNDLGNVITANTTINDETLYNGLTYTLNNSLLTGNSNGRIILNGILKGVKFIADYVAAIFMRDKSTVSECTIDNAANVGVDINTTASNLRIHNSNIEALNYSVLIDNAANGKNTIIDSNILHSNNGDAIEVNTSDGTYSNTLIANNILSAGADGGSGNTAGFSVGIAEGINVLVNSNISDHSRQEAIHIEDSPQRVSITDNIFNDCQFHGITLEQRYGTYGKTGKPVIHSDNHYVGNGNNIGVNPVIASEIDDSIVLSRGNVIDNFAYGAQNYGGSVREHYRLFDDAIINCTTGIKGAIDIHGNTLFDDVQTCVEIDGNSKNILIDSINVLNAPSYDNIIKISGSNSRATIKHFFLSKNVSSISTRKMILKPRYAKGLLYVKVDAGANGYVSKVYDVSGTALTQLDNQTYGALSLTVSFDDDSLLITMNSSVSGLFEVDFDGVYVI